jgi:hypothetical protein
MTTQSSPESRRYPRVATPQGIWVSWTLNGKKNTSRVRDLNIGGVFVATPEPPPKGARIGMLFSVQEGEIRTDGLVRNVSGREGVGVEFVDTPQADSLRLKTLVARLLRAQAKAANDPAPPHT